MIVNIVYLDIPKNTWRFEWLTLVSNDHNLHEKGSIQFSTLGLWWKQKILNQEKEADLLVSTLASIPTKTLT